MDAIQQLLRGDGPLMRACFLEFRQYAIMGPKYAIYRIVGISGAREKRKEVPSAIGYIAVNHLERRWFAVAEDVNCADHACKKENDGYKGYALFAEGIGGCNIEKLPTFDDLMETAGFGIQQATPEPLWQQARREEIKRINNANEYDIGSITNYDPDGK